MKDAKSETPKTVKLTGRELVLIYTAFNVAVDNYNNQIPRVIPLEKEGTALAIFKKIMPVAKVNEESNRVSFEDAEFTFETLEKALILEFVNRPFSFSDLEIKTSVIEKLKY